MFSKLSLLRTAISNSLSGTWFSEWKPVFVIYKDINYKDVFFSIVERREYRTKETGRVRTTYRVRQTNKGLKEALRESIIRWHDIYVEVDAYGLCASEEDDYQPRFDMGMHSCPLCRYVGDDCKSCPVYEHTGQEFCEGTPYEIVAPLLSEGKTCHIPKRTILSLIAAQTEYLFSRLIDLEKKTG